MNYPQRTTTWVKGRWGRIRRRTLWSRLGPEEMTELNRLTPDVARAYTAAVESDLISSRQPDQPNDKDPLFIRSLTAERYLRYCALCICAIWPPENRPSAREIYCGWADGRHGGLLDLSPNSARAFRGWLTGSERIGSHPFEFVRDQIMLLVRQRYIGPQVWLSLRNRKGHVSPDLVVAALALRSAGVPVCVEDARVHAVFAAGNDFVGVADACVWNIGIPKWPTDAGILNTSCQAFSVSELEKFPDVLDQIEWFPGKTVLVEVG
jgi:hypothetical protein